MVKKKDLDIIVTGTTPTSFKFDQVGPDDKKLDFEMMGKILDNILIVAEQDKKPLAEGKDYTIEFSVGNKEMYKANIHVFKKYIQFTILYERELTKQEIAKGKKFTAKPPKVKKEIEEIMKKSKEDVIKHVQKNAKK